MCITKSRWNSPRSIARDGSACRRSVCSSTFSRSGLPRRLGGSMRGSVSTDEIADGLAQLGYPRLEMSGRVNAVGEKRPGKSALEIDPETGAGEPGVAEGRVRTDGAAGPAVVFPFPAERALR